MIGQVGKELHNAQKRILNHKVFVNGEIEGFINDFEAKRNDSEVEALFKVTEAVGTLKYDLAEKCIRLGTSHLGEILLQLNHVLGEVENLLGNLDSVKWPSYKESATRKTRVHRKEGFDQELEHHYLRVESSFAVKEEEISDLYSDLHVKLNIPK